MSGRLVPDLTQVELFRPALARCGRNPAEQLELPLDAVKTTTTMTTVRIVVVIVAIGG